MTAPPDPAATLYGLGVGPGDPELITVKALRLIRACPVIAYPAPETGASFARRIVAGHLAPNKIEVPIRMPMLADRFPAQTVYDRAAEGLGAHLTAGRPVAVLCEGDPFFYGSFLHLFARMAERHRVEVVPGVSSLMAAAAALGAPLATRNDVLTVLPATLPEAALADRLARFDAVAIVKLGRHFAKVRAVLDRLGLAAAAHYVEHATLADQRVMPLHAVDPARAPYFSMILLHRRGRAWHAESEAMETRR